MDARRCYIYLLLFAVVGGPVRLLGQTNASIPNIIPKSPDAAALFKFTEVPVSAYTGSTSTSVPLSTIEAKGIKVPVSISYHSGGIRLSEESGVVGLGWALQTGGAISRTIMDKDDFHYGYFTASVPQVVGDLSGSQPSQPYTTYNGSYPVHIDLGNYVFDFLYNQKLSRWKRGFFKQFCHLAIC